MEAGMMNKFKLLSRNWLLLHLAALLALVLLAHAVRF
jgi:hypothetical protein